MKENTIHLRKLKLPIMAGDKFELSCLKTYGHKDYIANCWQTLLSSNGRYVASPTTIGKIFIWNIRTAEVTAILAHHEDFEVLRCSLFHPNRKVFLTCGDESTIKVYAQDDTEVSHFQKLQQLQSSVQSIAIDTTNNSSHDLNTFSNVFFATAQ